MSGHWDYRLVQGNDMLWLLEVYYDDNDVIWGWSDSHVVMGENLVAVKDNLEMLADAFDKPILNYTDLPHGKDLNPISSDEMIARMRKVVARRDQIAEIVGDLPPHEVVDVLGAQDEQQPT